MISTQTTATQRPSLHLLITLLLLIFPLPIKPTPSPDHTLNRSRPLTLSLPLPLRRLPLVSKSILLRLQPKRKPLTLDSLPSSKAENRIHISTLKPYLLRRTRRSAINLPRQSPIDDLRHAHALIPPRSTPSEISSTTYPPALPTQPKYDYRPCPLLLT